MKKLSMLVAGLAALSVWSLVSWGQQSLETTPVTIVSGEVEHAFVLELANDPEEIRVGLMSRDALPEAGGMLFDFGAPREPSMWMKDTRIPLDMLFVDSDGTVLAMAEDTEPMSTRIINPGVAVKAVIELNAGTAARLGIRPGDKVLHPIFDPS